MTASEALQVFSEMVELDSLRFIELRVDSSDALRELASELRKTGCTIEVMPDELTLRAMAPQCNQALNVSSSEREG